METLLKLKVAKSGFKKKYLAEQLGIKPNYFYMCMKGLRELSKEKQDLLKKIID
jgi:hypothetical protein